MTTLETRDGAPGDIEVDAQCRQEADQADAVADTAATHSPSSPLTPPVTENSDADGKNSDTDGTTRPSQTRWEIENATDRTLSVRLKSGRLIVPPLGCNHVAMTEVDVADLDRGSAASVLVRRDPDEKVEVNDGLLFGPGLVIFFSVLFAKEPEIEPAARIGAWAAAAVGVIGLGVVGAARFGKLPAVASWLKGLPRRCMELAYLGAVTLIVIAAPGAILFFGSDVPGLLDMAAQDHAATVALIGIAVQLVSIVGASALPVVLYFVFDREKLKTLRQKFDRHIFRLDPAIRTRTDLTVKYGQMLDEAYGRRTEERLLPGGRSPILLATGVMTLGWAIALLNTNVALPDAGTSLTDLLTPTPTATSFAFLGAYFFTLNHVMRGYVRGDLRPKTYAQVAARTVGVVILAFVLEQLVRVGGGQASSPELLTLAFVAGIVPETVLIRLQDFLRAITRTSRAQRLYPIYESDPLTELDGIDIYDRARLLNEGISNVEGLAHHDLVDLLLKTRIPASRLVDWVDQAMLYIHCPRDTDDAKAEKAQRESRPSVRQQLRNYGIRSATDLEQAHKAACARGRKGEEQFLSILETSSGRPPVLRVILDALEDEDWMPSLRYWHEHEAVPQVLRVPEDLATFWASPAR